MLYIMMTTLTILLFDDDRWLNIPTCDSLMWFGLHGFPFLPILEEKTQFLEILTSTKRAVIIIHEYLFRVTFLSLKIWHRLNINMPYKMIWVPKVTSCLYKILPQSLWFIGQLTIDTWPTIEKLVCSTCSVSRASVASVKVQVVPCFAFSKVNRAQF